MNPYRRAFYSSQSRWHDYRSPNTVRENHEKRRPYYEWYTRGWLPHDKETYVLDIGCGSGQFLYFLKYAGFKNVVGIDIDEEQIKLSQSLGLNCICASVEEYLSSTTDKFGVITMFDLLEHLKLQELFQIMNLVIDRLDTGGILIVSVPNAESPSGLFTRYSDITHEVAFTVTSLSEVMFCHGLSIFDVRDPWPAPISATRKIYRILSSLVRRIEAVRFRLLGLPAPKYWSPVIYAVARKQANLRVGQH